MDELDIQETVLSENLERVLWFTRRSALMVALAMLPIVAIVAPIRIDDDLVLLVLLVIPFMTFAVLLTNFHQAVNDSWIANWKYASQILTMSGVSIEDYIQLFAVEYSFKRLIGYGMAFILLTFISYLLEGTMLAPVIYLIAFMFFGFFLREMALPHVRFYTTRIFARKVERLRANARLTLISTVLASLLIAVSLRLLTRELGSWRPELVLLSGFLLGVAISAYERLHLEVSPEPIRLSALEITTPILLLTLLTPWKPEGLEWILGMSLVGLSAVSYAVLSLGVASYAYFTFTDIKRIEEKELIGKVFDSDIALSWQVNRLLISSVIALIALKALFELMPARPILDPEDVICLASGITAGLALRARKVLMDTLRRIAENKERVFAMKRKIERRKVKRKLPEKRVAKLEATYEEEDLDKWLKLFEKMSSFLEE